MSDIERRAPRPPAQQARSGKLSPRRERRELERQRRAIADRNTVVKDVLDSAADVTEHGMHRTAELDRTRQWLGGTNEVLHKLLYEQEVGFVNTALHAQQSFRREV